MAPNKWNIFVKKWAIENRMSYGCALSDAKCKKDYLDYKNKINPLQPMKKKELLKIGFIEQEKNNDDDYFLELIKKALTQMYKDQKMTSPDLKKLNREDIDILITDFFDSDIENILRLNLILKNIVIKELKKQSNETKNEILKKLSKELDRKIELEKNRKKRTKETTTNETPKKKINETEEDKKENRFIKLIEGRMKTGRTFTSSDLEKYESDKKKLLSKYGPGFENIIILMLVNNINEKEASKILNEKRGDMKY